MLTRIQTNQHSLVPVDSAKFKLPKLTKCKRHDQEVEALCTNCKYPICSVCMLLEHKGHDYNDDKMVLQRYLTEINTPVTNTPTPKAQTPAPKKQPVTKSPSQSILF